MREELLDEIFEDFAFCRVVEHAAWEDAVLRVGRQDLISATRDATLLFGLEVAMCLYADERFEEAEIPFTEALGTIKKVHNLASTLDKGCVAESSSIDARIYLAKPYFRELILAPALVAPLSCGCC
jgi:hypothetical protein